MASLETNFRHIYFDEDNHRHVKSIQRHKWYLFLPSTVFGFA